MKVDLTPLDNALKSLGLVIKEKKTDIVRDATIQRFEYCFELSWKSLKRYFEWNQKLSESNVKNIIREAGKQGLIDSVERWFLFLDARNKTSHTYDLKTAEAVFDQALGFYPEAKKLFERLQVLQK